MIDPRIGSIPGHLHDVEILLLAEEVGKIEKGVIVELGSYLGKSTATVASNLNDGVTFYAIDLWNNIGMNLPEEDTYKQFCENTAPWEDKVIRVRKNTVEMGKWWNQKVDMLFIDADHSYEGVTKDLNAWYPHVKYNGVILLHDYTENCGVKPAFENFARVHSPARTKVVSSILKVIK